MPLNPQPPFKPPLILQAEAIVRRLEAGRGDPLERVEVAALRTLVEQQYTLVGMLFAVQAEGVSQWGPDIRRMLEEGGAMASPLKAPAT